LVYWELRLGEGYVPSIYSNCGTSTPIIFNVKSCDYKCATCDTSISVDHCLTCSDATNRDSSKNCICKDGFFDNNDIACVAC